MKLFHKRLISTLFILSTCFLQFGYAKSMDEDFFLKNLQTDKSEKKFLRLNLKKGQKFYQTYEYEIRYSQGTKIKDLFKVFYEIDKETSTGYLAKAYIYEIEREIEFEKEVDSSKSSYKILSTPVEKPKYVPEISFNVLFEKNGFISIPEEKDLEKLKYNLYRLIQDSSIRVPVNNDNDEISIRNIREIVFRDLDSSLAITFPICLPGPISIGESWPFCDFVGMKDNCFIFTNKHIEAKEEFHQTGLYMLDSNGWIKNSLITTKTNLCTSEKRSYQIQ